MVAPRLTLDRLFNDTDAPVQPGSSNSDAVNPTRRAFLAGGCLCLACSFAGPVLADAPMAKSRAPGFYRLTVGDFEVTALSDGTNMLPATKLLRGDPARIEDALKRDYLGDVVETSHNSFLVNTGAKLVLIDAGAGSLLGATTGQLVGNLRASGYRPEQVDELYLTHLHTDHVGGLMAGNDRVFPNAIVRVDKRDTDFWLSEASLRAAPAEARRFFEAAVASITPYMRAGKLAVFEGDTDLVPGVRAQAAYGHTPGHTMYVVESGCEKVVLWGDVVHVAAVQFKDPSVTIGYDGDASEAENVHRLAFADAAKNGYIVGGAHISFPGLGRVRHDAENVYTYVPLNYG
ncbi:MAG: MBL fold metallo-hydrolase [Mesorhizobium sp.]|uniref:MBL fold metallo-hydrolase n=2 Tax=Mesorhizobium TaxID=68287 RepID=UPI000FCA32EC|nr:MULTISPECIES: MBL fold metallo-hydrolase [unclassified Mesorhizobium]RUX49118.1 MBL fold metallo-hydrolase [Mesorhizobium sp. M4A.F.Ca.ET.050.02.1.1]RVD41146.1 MBL fold metallo-hydrolase [Mesorhizobium sp. M4A.F.Ca.ET.020.02.1.1]RWC20606.1 MAG: MBL fold metallo-hydrolase [Mesorhizobium sp.]RWC40756.1 MAG: MBL fold metallo-hydrolase [Mesorhizobium sp.]RWD07407.1 MAG: MBL fold metallo-hydrolase [Mesorhizobium sp.]